MCVPERLAYACLNMVLNYSDVATVHIMEEFMRIRIRMKDVDPDPGGKISRKLAQKVL